MGIAWMNLAVFLGQTWDLWYCNQIPQIFKTHIFHIFHNLHISSTCEKLMLPWNPVLLPGVSSRLPPPGHSSGSTSPHGHLTRAHQGSLSHGNGAHFWISESLFWTTTFHCRRFLFGFFETKGKVSLPVSLDYDPNTLTTNPWGEAV